MSHEVPPLPCRAPVSDLADPVGSLSASEVLLIRTSDDDGEALLTLRGKRRVKGKLPSPVTRLLDENKKREIGALDVRACVQSWMQLARLEGMFDDGCGW